MKRYILANPDTGVYCAESVDADQEIMNVDCFYDALEDLEYGITVCAFFSDADSELFELIKNEYGI